jgi:hypothetical protein
MDCENDILFRGEADSRKEAKLLTLFVAYGDAPTNVTSSLHKAQCLMERHPELSWQQWMRSPREKGPEGSKHFPE